MEHNLSILYHNCIHGISLWTLDWTLHRQFYRSAEFCCSITCDDSNLFVCFMTSASHLNSGHEFLSSYSQWIFQFVSKNMFTVSKIFPPARIKHLRTKLLVEEGGPAKKRHRRGVSGQQRQGSIGSKNSLISNSLLAEQWWVDWLM